MSFLRTLLERRAAFKVEASRLIEAHGPEKAWQEARSKALGNVGNMDARFMWKVMREIERRSGMKRQTDGATRYLE